LYLSNSNSSVTNSTFTNNGIAGSVHGSGLRIIGGAPTLTGNTFDGNYYGINVDSKNARIENNTISNSQNFAVYTVSTPPSIFGNSGSGNVSDVIVLTGYITESNETTTLQQNGLNYLLSGVVNVVASSTLAINSGVIIEGQGGGTTGRLDVEGSLDTDTVTFTSVASNKTDGAWYGIVLYSGATATLQNTTVEYAGKKIFQVASAGLSIRNGASAPVANSTFDSNANAGILVGDTAELTISDSIIKNHTQAHSGNAVGIKTSAGSVYTPTNITFENNTVNE
jgi:parallel beta-helix repeat protein